MSRQLSFLICGAQKSGTTALYNYLSGHPSLFLPTTKELHIFDNENKDWSNEYIEMIDRDIHHHFKDAPSENLCGEATPVSLFWQYSAERIWRYNPAMKLIAILRNPITRAYSQWNMEVQRGRDAQPFNTSLENEEKRGRNELPLQPRVYSYLNRGFYSVQLRRLWHFFPRQQVLILRQEQLQREPEQTLEQVCQHLGIDRLAFKQNEQSHTREYLEVMPKETRKDLEKLYCAEIAQLESMLGWDCSEWMEADLKT